MDKWKYKGGEKIMGIGENTIDHRFKLLESFKLIIPEGYNHNTQLASFSKENHQKFAYYDNAINDRSFIEVTNKLIPRKTYIIKIFGINQIVLTSKDCIEFLKTQKVIFVGAQGLSLAWQQCREKFPVGKSTVSFDERDALWKDGLGGYGVPKVSQALFGYWFFDLGYFEFAWGPLDCLMCFCE